MHRALSEREFEWTPALPAYSTPEHRRRPRWISAGDENDRGGVAGTAIFRFTAAATAAGPSAGSRGCRGRAGAADGRRRPRPRGRSISASNHEVSIRALAEKIVALTGSRSQIITHRRPRRRRAASPTSSARRNWMGAARRWSRAAPPDQLRRKESSPTRPMRG